jgi:hypothetical protein
VAVVGKIRKEEKLRRRNHKKTTKRKGQRKFYKWSRDGEMISSETRYVNKLGKQHTA